MIKEQASLYFSEGSSDKEYHAQIVERDGGFVVNFQYGRRGSALAAGTKTALPVSFDAAKKVFDKLVKEKTSKGYTPDVSGAAFQGTENAGSKTDFVPQLLNPITEDVAMRLIADDDYAAQEKMDGERRAVYASNGVVTGINRKGLAVPLPQAIHDAFLEIGAKGDIRADGEIIGDTLYIFDLHCIDGRDLRREGWYKRMVLANCSFFDIATRPVSVAVTTDEKRSLWDRVKADRGEGVVFKLKAGVVKPGRPNSGGNWLKFKFVESASCKVSSVHASKRSVSIELYDESGAMVPVGNVTIPPNYDIPQAGDIVEVEYLYAYKGGSLYQPVYRGKRADIDPDACKITQLKFKPEGRIEGDDGDQG